MMALFKWILCSMFVRRSFSKFYMLIWCI